VLSDRYRAYWPRIGAIIAMFVGGVTAMAGKRLTKPQILSAANLMALMAHQYEEYVHPGYFPGQFNRGLFESESPRNYPLNPQTAMVINTGLMRDRNSPYAFTAKQMGPYDSKPPMRPKP
jgi:hypothetical protein